MFPFRAPNLPPQRPTVPVAEPEAAPAEPLRCHCGSPAKRTVRLVCRKPWIGKSREQPVCGNRNHVLELMADYYVSEAQ